MTDADYTDDRVLLANTPVQAESLQHSLESVAEGTDLYINVNKTEVMCFNQEEAFKCQASKISRLVCIQLG